MIFTTALITNVLIVISFFINIQECLNLVYLFILHQVLYSVSMNGIRQSLAAAIIFAATKYILNGNFKKFLWLVLLASTFHQTALIFIPIYFIVRRKAWTKATFILLSLGVLIAIGFNEFSELLFSAIEDTQYGHYSEFYEGGANIKSCSYYCTISYCFFGKRKIKGIMAAK